MIQRINQLDIIQVDKINPIWYVVNDSRSANNLVDLEYNVINLNGYNTHDIVKLLDSQKAKQYHFILAIDKQEQGKDCLGAIIRLMNDKGLNYSICNLYSASIWQYIEQEQRILA